MNIYELLVGKKVKIETDMKVEVELEIASVEVKNHEREITPSTRENDFWGESLYWDTYLVTFTNGAKKEFDKIHHIKVLG